MVVSLLFLAIAFAIGAGFLHCGGDVVTGEPDYPWAFPSLLGCCVGCVLCGVAYFIVVARSA